MLLSNEELRDHRTGTPRGKSQSDNSIAVRVASEADADRMLSLYRPMVQNTVITFEDHPPELNSFRERVRETLQRFPWLVADIDGVLVGYCYAGPHRSRAAYSWSCESSVYVAEGQRRRGIGAILYDHLFTVLRAQGFRNVLAILTLPNAPSVRLHESVGFQRIGLHNSAGLKHGNWHDVLWMAKDLYPLDQREQPKGRIDRPRPFSDLYDSGEVEQLLSQTE